MSKASGVITEALDHSDIQELFPDIFFVTGSIGVKMPLLMKFSRNMVIIRENEELTLINSVRLGEEGLKKLEQLGEIKNIIRLAAFHGVDDPFYQERFKATVWSVNAPYVRGFDYPPKEQDIYFHPDIVLDPETKLPVSDAQYVQLQSSKPAEGLLVLKRSDGIIVSGDCLQNWEKTDPYFNVLGKTMMKMMGFIKPCNIGPGWLKVAKPDGSEIGRILDLEFQHVLPAHGQPVIDNAKERYRPVITKLG